MMSIELGSLRPDPKPPKLFEGNDSENDVELKYEDGLEKDDRGVVDNSTRDT